MADFEDMFDALSHALLTPLLGDSFEFEAAEAAPPAATVATATFDLDLLPKQPSRPARIDSVSSDSEAGDGPGDESCASLGCALCTNAPSPANPFGLGFGLGEVQTRWHAGLRAAYVRWYVSSARSARVRKHTSTLIWTVCACSISMKHARVWGAGGRQGWGVRDSPFRQTRLKRHPQKLQR